ncbi:holliday junction ATP-dependent DNA helicase ruvB [Mycobacterium ulcerans str. Harvey]|uniref:Holliday junction ATP-dependent DNA helicase ruvB n=1 Tax=Mycobacterium ulcerans str. Harvey TaxID=1299332 RepID=A0ABN0R901_MYCUL|nr:holliday junction ATP-dependent DNA helicase ruvB [Mycobacterium ulcerans str. Harvey]
MSTDPDEREVSPALTVGDGDVDVSLRPRSLREFIGQPRVREQLQLVIQGAKNRGGTPDHILLSGPPGLGKTSLAVIIAAELGSSLRMTSGPALERAGDLAAMLSNLVEHDVLFIDEIHRIARPAEEMLYLAMEDFRSTWWSAKGRGDIDSAGRRAVHPGRATTRSGALTGRCVTGSVSPHTWIFMSLLSWSECWSVPPEFWASNSVRTRGRDRPPVTRDSADRQPAVAPRP